VVSLLTVADDNPIFDFDRMQQLSTLGTAISWIAVDPNHMTLLVGSYEGEIFKVPVDISEQNLSNFEDKDNIDQDLGSPTKEDIVVEDIVAQPIGTEVKQGIPLCSRSLF
jgi:hypothetical protein